MKVAVQVNMPAVANQSGWHMPPTVSSTDDEARAVGAVQQRVEATAGHCR